MLGSHVLVLGSNQSAWILNDMFQILKNIEKYMFDENLHWSMTVDTAGAKR